MNLKIVLIDYSSFNCCLLCVILLDELDILIKGEEEVICGDFVSFEVEIKLENIGDWLIIWWKCIGNDIRCIDISMEKYRGSIIRKLVI